MGRPLFDRVGKQVVMTEAGEQFLAFAARALKEVDQGRGDAAPEAAPRTAAFASAPPTRSISA